MIAIEIVGAVDSAGTLKTFYVSDDVLVTLSTDTPANIAFNPVLLSASIATSAFKDSQTGGSSATYSGELSIKNIDGEFDDWINYSFDGRSIAIREGSGAYPAGFRTLFVGTVSSVTADFRQIALNVQGKQLIFDKPLQPNLYKGTNVLPDGLEGVGDIKGKPKPRLYGSVYNIQPVLINTSKLTYQVNDGAIDTIFVRDRGVFLINAGNFATSAELQNAGMMLSGGSFYTCLNEGLFRLGAAPTGKVTCNVIQGASNARNVPAILRAMALAAGLNPAHIDETTFAAAVTANPAIVGIYADDDITVTDAMDQVANSIGAFYGFTPAGLLTTAMLTVPNGTPQAYFADYDILSIERRSAKDNGIPAYSVVIEYLKNYAPFSNDVAGAAGIVESANLSKSYRNETARDTTVQAQFLMAEEITKQTLLMAGADAASEAARLLAIYKVRRDIIEIAVNFQSLPATPLSLMSVVSLTFGRFGLSAGRLFRVLGLEYDLKSRQAVITLWG